jgi:tRNA U34 5-methylaminomethyl-2-thiouridine-forming methyltransferase MnmC
MSKSFGNKYAIEKLDNGVVSFRHIQSGEILHGSVGPEKEARELYIEASGLSRSNKSTVTVFEVGTGCAAQLLALLDFMSEKHNIQHLNVFSFDLEKDGIAAVLSASDTFPAAHRHRDFLENALQYSHFVWNFENGNRLNWSFVEGDFRETLSNLNIENNETADFIFYDFFSPANHPWLWTYELFTTLKKYSNEDTCFVTYSSATCVKAALLAAGWFVGTTIASGKKAKSIFAANSLSNVKTPLPGKFISTFKASHKPFCGAETQESKKTISEKLEEHPQFKQQLYEK